MMCRRLCRVLQRHRRRRRWGLVRLVPLETRHGAMFPRGTQNSTPAVVLALKPSHSSDAIRRRIKLAVMRHELPRRVRQSERSQQQRQHHALPDILVCDRLPGRQFEHGRDRAILRRRLCREEPRLDRARLGQDASLGVNQHAFDRPELPRPTRTRCFPASRWCTTQPPRPSFARSTSRPAPHPSRCRDRHRAASRPAAAIGSSPARSSSRSSSTLRSLGRDWKVQRPAARAIPHRPRAAAGGSTAAWSRQATATPRASRRDTDGREKTSTSRSSQMRRLRATAEQRQDPLKAVRQHPADKSVRATLPNQ